MKPRKNKQDPLILEQHQWDNKYVKKKKKILQ